MPNETYMSHACKSIPKNIFNFFFIKCILLQISHKNVFLLIFLYSGVPGLKKITHATCFKESSENNS